jgi:hypothetical protein
VADKPAARPDEFMQANDDKFSKNKFMNKRLKEGNLYDLKYRKCLPLIFINCRIIQHFLKKVLDNVNSK